MLKRGKQSRAGFLEGEVRETEEKGEGVSQAKSSEVGG